MKTVSVGTTQTTIVPPGTYPFIHIYNAGSNAVYVKYDGDSDAVTTSLGIPIEAGKFLFLNNDAGGKNPFVHGVYGIVASGTETVRVQGAE